MSEFNDLVDRVSDRIIDKAREFITTDAWDLISDDGKQDLLSCATLMAECALREAIGQDCSLVKAALLAAIGNWESSGRIRMAGHVDEFLDILKEGMIEAGEIAFRMLGASVRGLVLGA